MVEVILFKTTQCPRCVEVGNCFEEEGIPFKEIYLDTPEGKTEAATDYGVFALEAPVVLIRHRAEEGYIEVTPNVIFGKGYLDRKKLLGYIYHQEES